MNRSSKTAFLLAAWPSIATHSLGGICLCMPALIATSANQSGKWIIEGNPGCCSTRALPGILASRIVDEKLEAALLSHPDLNWDKSQGWIESVTRDWRFSCGLQSVMDQL